MMVSTKNLQMQAAFEGFKNQIRAWHQKSAGEGDHKRKVLFPSVDEVMNGRLPIVVRRAEHHPRADSLRGNI